MSSVPSAAIPLLIWMVVLSLCLPAAGAETALSKILADPLQHDNVSGLYPSSACIHS